MRHTRPTPPPPPADDEATQVHTDWQSMLHRHLLPPDLPAVEPYLNAQASDGIRHPVQPTPTNDERQVFPRIARPPANYQYPQHPPTPNTATIPPQFQDPTDIGAQLSNAQNHTPYTTRRVLEYYGDPRIRNILVVVGYQVHKATAQGVLITENGPSTHRTLIPWHRVHDLKFGPDDPIISEIN